MKWVNNSEVAAGSADFKTELSQSNVFDRRLKGKILKVVDVSNGGEDGFNQAIKLSAEKLGNVKFMQEIHIIGKYFEEISRDSGKYVVGLDDTLKVLETGAVETLIVWENLDLTRRSLWILSSNQPTSVIPVQRWSKNPAVMYVDSGLTQARMWSRQMNDLHDEMKSLVYLSNMKVTFIHQVAR
ncbi:eukaryotic peptide chain release factor subunit 1-2-like [Capsicum annuum]|uniref:eukaryotic peptide chain release factor subunit 1-2-like n=1 Tax=Capsicum annuum TaxID=4072 RepID=UPI001FB0F3BE|nr:eukaryotic peptide chain release factor subunit 1-2-like [Capsicum annuum]